MRDSCVSALRPVVLCPYLCAPESLASFTLDAKAKAIVLAIVIVMLIVIVIVVVIVIE